MPAFNWSKLIPFLEKDLPVVAKAAPIAEREASGLPSVISKDAEVLGKGTSKYNIPEDLPIEDADVTSPLLNDVNKPSSLQEKWNQYYKPGMAITGTGLAATALMNGGQPDQPNKAASQTPQSNPTTPAPQNIDVPESEEEKAIKEMIRQASVPSAMERMTIPKTSEVDFGQGQSIANLQKLQELQQQMRDAQRANEGGRIGAAMAAGMSGQKNMFEPIFEERAKNIAQMPQQYLQQVAFEKEDPNSPVSQGYRQLAKAMGFDIKGTASAADLEKLYPQLSNIYTQREAQATRRDIARENRESKLEQLKLKLAGTQDAKAQQQTTKRFDDLNKKLVSELASSRTSFGIDAKTLQGVQNVKALIQGKDPNDLDNREVYEVAKVLDRILSQGAPTISGSSKLTPETARGLVSKYLEFFTNKRRSADAGSFINRFGKTLDREEQQATNRIVNTQGKLLASYADLKQRDPEKWDLLFQMHNLPPDLLEKHVVNQQSVKQGAETAPKQDAKVINFAKQYNMTYDDALKLLQKRGYNAGQ